MEIAPKSAQNVIKSFQDRIDYGLSIMDSRGIIVASTEPERVGSFNELAYSLITARRADAVKCLRSSDYLGALPGVCMAFRLPPAADLSGAFCLSGDPDRLFPLAPLMQISIETAFGYELRESGRSHAKGLRAGFLAALTGGSPLRHSELEAWAEQLHFDPGMIRLPLLISAEGESLSALTDTLKKSLPPQDILAPAEDGHIFLFKAFPGGADELLGTYRETVRLQFEQICSMLRPLDAAPSCCTGSFVHRLSAYSHSCRRCFWLARETRGSAGLSFFYDHVSDYLFSLLPPGEMYDIFGVMSGAFDENAAGEFVRIISALDANNYNLVRSSAGLFMHKNTLSATLERIKDLTYTNPMHSASDRKLLYALARYMDHIEGRRLPSASRKGG